MAKEKKKSATEKTTGTLPTSPAEGSATPQAPTPKAKKPAVKKKAATKVAKPVTKKKAAPIKRAAKAKKPVSVKVEIAIEEISLRAYYIAERRRNMGWPGDETSDWVEAERQLRAEAEEAPPL